MSSEKPRRKPVRHKGNHRIDRTEAMNWNSNWTASDVRAVEHYDRLIGSVEWTANASRTEAQLRGPDGSILAWLNGGRFYFGGGHAPTEDLAGYPVHSDENGGGLVYLSNASDVERGSSTAAKPEQRRPQCMTCFMHHDPESECDR